MAWAIQTDPDTLDALPAEVIRAINLFAETVLANELPVSSAPAIQTRSIQFIYTRSPVQLLIVVDVP